MACADADTLAALLANALGEAERAAIAVHAATCEPCHALLDGLLDAHPDKIRAGALVGRYRIGERLGAGGMGVVYAAVDTELQRRVAVKLLRPDGGGELGTQGRERLIREARVLASLSHPEVVTVYDIGEHDGDLFLAMELVEGGNLNAWLRAAPRKAAEILDLLVDAARGLAAAHAAGVVHRDVKPDNILVGRDGRARVTDFGLARLERAALEVSAPSELSPSLSPELTRAGARVGTPVYMAPEQLESGEADTRSDQWSFCAMIYEVLAGVRPFPTDDRKARVAAIREGRVATPAAGRRIPGWVLRIVTRGLRADPDARWPSMHALVAALERGRRRRTRLSWSLAGVAVLLAAAGTTFALASRGRRAPGGDSTAIHLPDPRPGCGCPMSACTTGCVSVCRASDFRVGAPIPGVSVPGRQEILLGISGDGDTILYLAGTHCSADRLMLARRRGDTYESVDLSDRLDRTRVAFYEGCCTLAASGNAMILARPDRRGFVRVRLSGADPQPIGAGDELGALVPAIDHVIAQFPTLSADELTLYYRVFDHSAGPDDLGPLDATYAATRTERDAPFAPGTRLPGRARYYDIVTGVSSDNLSLFMASEYRTHVLVRASLDKPFTDPGEGMLPAWLPGWRAMPVTDCRRIATTWTPGGCGNEDIVWLEAVP